MEMIFQPAFEFENSGSPTKSNPPDILTPGPSTESLKEESYILETTSSTDLATNNASEAMLFAVSHNSKCLIRNSKKRSRYAEKKLKKQQRNERERDRYNSLNDAFQSLRQVLPDMRKAREPSKIETVTLAKHYIMTLTNTIYELNELPIPYKMFGKHTQNCQIDSGVVDEIHNGKRQKVDNKNCAPQTGCA
ncbi:UNVERIFIED_CONTAM: dimm [Trichonephila clavipes]